MYFLDTNAGYLLFRREAQKKTYVDKSLMVDALYRYTQETKEYVCVTRPRRFGKTVAANMIAAFFGMGAAEESRALFTKLALGKLREEQQAASREEQELPLCWALQGKCHVIHINMIHVLTSEVKSYAQFEEVFRRKLLRDLQAVWSDPVIEESTALSDALEAAGCQFIFVIDEWDAIFEARFMTKDDKESYLLLLKGLLKDKPYIHFVYMTGILPIAKYSSGSSLNMFAEFTSFQDEVFYPWFGLTREEIVDLMTRKGITKPSIEDLSFWYDGYIRDQDGLHMYNPTSVSLALAAGGCRSHWTGTGPMNEVQDTIRLNVKDLREDVIRMTGGEALDIKLSGFSVEKTKVSTKDEILSSMVVYGFLTYHDRKLSIPNHELKLKFQQALSSESLGLKQTFAASRTLLDATLTRDHETVARMIEELHDEKIPFFQYNDENSLACVVVMGYLAALDDYQIVREDKAGKGYADFTFTPFRKSDTAIVLELKYGHSAEDALKSIREREYAKKFKDYARILLVGINYSEATKKHSCLTEVIEKTGEQLFLEDLNPHQCYVWRTLFRREFLLKINLKFFPGIYYQDVPFTHECYLKAEKCLRVSWLMNIYRIGHESATFSFNKKKAQDFCIVIAKTWELTRIEELSTETQKKLREDVYTSFSVMMCSTVHDIGRASERIEIVGFLRKQAPDLCFRNGIKQKIVSWMLNKYPHTYIHLRYIYAKTVEDRIRPFYYHRLRRPFSKT